MKRLLFLVLVLVLTATLNSCKEPIENYEDGKQTIDQQSQQGKTDYGKDEGSLGSTKNTK